MLSELFTEDLTTFLHGIQSACDILSVVFIIITFSDS